MINKRKIGNIYEELACKYLISLDFKILDRNFRTKEGEIDIIAKDKDYLVFVEVKYRKNNKLGKSIEAVTNKKVLQIKKLAKIYLYINNYSQNTNIRFDIIGIDGSRISFLKNAF